MILSPVLLLLIFIFCFYSCTVQAHLSSSLSSSRGGADVSANYRKSSSTVHYKYPKDLEVLVINELQLGDGLSFKVRAYKKSPRGIVVSDWLGAAKHWKKTVRSIVEAQFHAKWLPFGYYQIFL